MDKNKLKSQFTQLFLKVKKPITSLTTFITFKLKNYPTLSLGEKIAYPVTGMGFLFLLISLLLFLI